MNQTYRLVWNSQTGTFIPVSEATRGRGKSGGKSSTVSRTVVTTLVVLGACLGGSAIARPITNSNTQLTGVVAASPVDSFSNTGRMAVEETGVLVNGNVTAGVVNRSEIASGNGYGIQVKGNLAGGFLNGVGARLSAKDHALFVEGNFVGNLENRGAIVSGGFNAIKVQGLFNGNLLNDTGALLQAEQAAISLSSDLNGNITNRGVIASDGKAIEVDGVMTGSLINDTGARISGSSAALQIAGNLIGNITNRGDLISEEYGATIRLNGDLTGNILNAQGARILARRNALDIAGVMRGNFTNAGQVNATNDNPAIKISGGMVGNFINTETGLVSGGQSEGAINFGSYYTERDLTQIVLRGSFENQGLIVSEDGQGAVQFRGNVDGNFENTSTGQMLAKNHALNQSFATDGIRGDFLGDIRNAGLMGSGYITLRITGKMTGNFTNTDTGVIHSSGYSGVAILNHLGLTGHFSNAGTILGNTYAGATVDGQETPIVEFSRRSGNQSISVNNVNVTVPDFIGANPSVGVFIAGGQVGSFTNSGTIRAAQGVFIDGNLTGDWDNTGNISGAFNGLTITDDGDYEYGRGTIQGLRNFTGLGSAVVAGNFTGNFRNTVGQTLVVGDHVHDFIPSSRSHTITRDQVTTSIRVGTGEADLTGKTVAVHLKGAIDDGYTWNAIDAQRLLVDDGMTISDNSSLFNFTHQIVDGNLQVTANLTGTAPAPTPSSDVFIGIRRESLASGLNMTGMVENAGDAVFIGGNVTGDLVNHGTLNAFEGPLDSEERRQASGLFVQGNVNGDITNAPSAQIWAYEDAVRVTGDLTGGFTNAGSITTAYGASGLRIDGHVTGDVLNADSGQMVSRYDVARFLGGLTGDFVNDGLIVSRQDYAVKVGGAMNGSFVNSKTGRIYARKSALDVGEQLVGNITNAGELMSSGGEAFNLPGGMTGNFLNDVTGRIWADGSGVVIGFQYSDPPTGFDGNFTNLGEIDAGDYSAVVFRGDMNGTFTNGVGARLEGESRGVVFQGVTNADFLNAGDVISRGGFGVAFENSMTGNFTNAATGLISAAGTGVGFEAELIGNLTNAGHIRAYSLGGVAATTMTGHVRNTAGALIESSGDGLLFTGLLTGSVSNAGRITSLDGVGIDLRAGLTGDLTNSGTIESAASDAVRLSGTQGGTLTNTGRVAANGGAGVNLDSGITHAQLDNSGRITAATGSSDATAAGTGVYVHANADVNGMANSGTIDGSFKSLDLRNTENAFEVANTGVLRGDVYLGINTLNLNGRVARVVGDTSNTGGTVNVNGDFKSEGFFDVNNFHVANTGTFRMRHSVGGTHQTVMSNQGVLDLGNARRSLVGSYAQSANGTLALTFNDSSNYGKLNVTGDANLTSGGTVDVSIKGAPGARIDGVLISGEVLTASGLKVTDDSPLYNFTASNTRDTKELDLIRRADRDGVTQLAGRDSNPGLAGVAGALQTMFNVTVPADMEPFFEKLKALPEGEFVVAMNQMLPALQGEVDQASLDALRSMNKIIQARIEGIQGLSSGDSQAEGYLWARTFGSRADQHDHQGVPGFKSRTTGIVLGGDALVNDNTRAGLALTYARSDINSRSTVAPSHVDVDTYEIVGYSSVNIDDRTDINYQIDLGYNKANSHRRIFGGGSASANFTSLALHASAGVGRLYELSSQTSVTPSVRVDYTRMRTQGYTEQGAVIQGANLKVDASTFQELLLTADAKFTHQFNQKNKLVGNFTVGFDALNKQTQTSASFVGGGAAFQTQGLDASPWLHRFGLGLVHDDQKGFEFTVRVDHEARPSGYKNQTLSAKARWQF
jgi:hypothetical protein